MSGDLVEHALLDCIRVSKGKCICGQEIQDSRGDYYRKAEPSKEMDCATDNI